MGFGVDLEITSVHGRSKVLTLDLGLRFDERSFQVNNGHFGP